MSQEGRFPVLVEVDGPGGEGLGKQLCMYFNHRRKSGGEDCQVVQLGSNIFKVSFLHGQVQQRVLQRKEHVITRDSVERKLTVRSLEDGDEFSAEHQTLEARDTSGNLSAGNWPSLGAMPKGRRSLKNSAASMESGRSADSGEPGKRVAVDPAFRKRLDQREDVLRDLQQELLRARCKIRLDDAADSILLVPASRGASGEVAAGWGEGAERAFRRFQERVLGEDETGDRPQAGGETRAVARLEHPSRFSVIWPPFKEQLASCFPGLKWALDESRTSITFSGRPTFVRDAMSNLSTQMDQVLEQPIRLSDKKRAFLASWAPGELAKELFSFPVALELADDRATLLCSSWPELNRAKSILTSRIVQEEVDVQGDAQDWLQSRSPFPDELTNKVQVVEVRDKRGDTSKICIVGFEEEAKRVAWAVREHSRDSANVVECIEPDQQALVTHVHPILELMGCQGFQSTISTQGKRRIVLTGPKSIVEAEKLRLKGGLASVEWESLTVAEPGARAFFQGRGTECLAAVAKGTKCLVAMQEEDSPEPEGGGQSAIPGSGVLSSYRAGGSLTVTVCRGDITQQRVDAIVNAANGRLHHGGGVAGAIARAGGPEIEEESAALVRTRGSVPVGQAVMTGAGRLPCSKVIHAVGPEWRLREAIGVPGVELRLRGAVAASLELAENAGCTSMAIPCLSSGIFGVPKAMCAGNIVAAIKDFRGRSLRHVTLIDIDGDVLAELEKACGQAWPPPGPADQSAPAQAAPASALQLEILSGLIEDQESDVLVVPISRNMNPSSTAVSKAIFATFPTLMSSVRKAITVLGGMVRELDVSTDSRLNCKYIYFVHPETSSRFQSQPQQTLPHKIRACFEQCAKASCSSITFPAFGDPKEETARALLSEIQRFKENNQPSSIKRIQIAIPQRDTSSGKIYRRIQQELEAGLSGGRSAGEGSGSPYHSPSFSRTLARVNIGNAVLQIANGDITEEAVDAIVNSTSSCPPRFGVSSALSKAAQYSFDKELGDAKLLNGKIITTKGGMLKCKVIMHVCGMDDLDVIQRAVKNVIHECNKRRFESVALPAIGTGSGKLTPCAVAKAMIDTVTSVVPNSSLCMIRIVILNPQVFRSFAAALPHRGEPAADAGSANGAAKDEKQFCGPYESGEEVLPVVINVFGRDRASVLDALSRLKRIRDENFQELSALYPCPRRLPADFIGRLLQLGAQHGVRVTVERERVRARGERARAEAALASAGQLLEEAIKREWNELYSRVRWGYAYAGKEVGFEPGANFEIEQCHQNRSHETMVRSAGILFCINLDRKEATASEFKEVVKIRRSDSSSSV